MKLCFETEIAGYKIVLYKTGESFTVIYGCHKVEDVEYGRACQELGQSIFHAPACDGKLDNGGVDMKYVVCGVIKVNNESVLNQAVIEANDEDTARGKYIMDIMRSAPGAKLPFWPVATSQEEIDND